MNQRLFSVLVLLCATIGILANAQDVPFSPCPLLGPRFPISSKLSDSAIMQFGLQNLTTALNDYQLALNGTFGPVSASTSFSIALFSTEETNSTRPFMFEYHHTSESLKVKRLGLPDIDADTIYSVGDLTTMFTTWLFLVEAGEQYWNDPVSKWIPELMDAAQSRQSRISANWNEIKLGDLAAHLGGVGWFNSSYRGLELGSLLTGWIKSTATSPCHPVSASCDQKAFVNSFGRQEPVFAPGTTPILSNAGFIILAYALESITGRSYEDLLQKSILDPLSLLNTSYRNVPITNQTALLGSGQNSSSNMIEAPFNGLSSTVHDISIAMRAILSSTLLPPATTNRWLKPTSHTSNLVNSVGRPWEIYSLTATPISPVIPVYQVRGNIGLYASHIGLVPEYNVGFVILAADTETSPDLNAYADIIATQMIPALEQNAIVSASKSFAGTYVSQSNISLVIAQAQDSRPGLSVSSFTSRDVDVRAVYAELNGIAAENLSFRLYPTNVVRETAQGRKMVFRASFQDMSALADAGTPTCETWRHIDGLQVNGVSLDEFVFELDGDEAVSVEVPAFDEKLEKKGVARD